MEDKQIVDLYWQRSERAVTETQQKYGSYCYAIANRILGDPEDARETVNDTYLGAWNSIPPHKPLVLSSYLGKLTRRYALKRRERQSAQKRGSGEAALALEELSGCIPAGDSPQHHVEQRELTASLDRFLGTLPVVQRQVFVCRYWYLEPVADIAKRFGFSQSKVKSMLHRLRKQLKQHLEREGLYDEG